MAFGHSRMIAITVHAAVRVKVHDGGSLVRGKVLNLIEGGLEVLKDG